MKGFSMYISTKQAVNISEIRRFPGVEDARTYSLKSFSVKISLHKFYNNDWGLKKISEQEPINKFIEVFLNFIERLKINVEEYRITSIEYLLFYTMEPKKTLNSYQYIFKALAGQCLFEGAEGTQDWKDKIITKASFGDRKDIGKSSKRIEIYELGQDILNTKGEENYNQLKGIYPNIDQILIFNVRLKIPKGLELISLPIDDAKKMALEVVIKYLFPENVSSLYEKELRKSFEIVYHILKEGKDEMGFSHKELINSLLRKDQIHSFLSYAVAISKFYESKKSLKVIKSRVKKIFTDIEEEENLILLDHIKHIENMVIQIYKNN
jgi:hypothetical protein